jgi:hypothetical protein
MHSTPETSGKKKIHQQSKSSGDKGAGGAGAEQPLGNKAAGGDKGVSSAGALPSRKKSSGARKGLLSESQTTLNASSGADGSSE